MKNKLTTIFLLLCMLGFACGSAVAQLPAGKKLTGYSDLDFYNLQLEDKRAEINEARARYLQATISPDTLIKAYIDKGQGVWHDSINIFRLFNEWHTILTIEEQKALIDKMYITARKQKSKPLERLADLFNCEYAYKNSQTYEENMDYYEEFIRKFRKADDIDLETMALENMRFASFYAHRFARSCAYANRLAESLERAGEKYPYPRKIRANFAIGQTYYFFKDYDRALPFLYKATYHEGWNYLASYHQMNNNLDSATYYHRKVLSDREVPHVHHAIAISNLGRIEQAKGNTDVAIAMLEAGFDYMKNMDEGGFISGLHTSLGECYLEKGNMSLVREHIESALAVLGSGQNYRIDAVNQMRRKGIYALQSRYYARMGRHDLAQSALDSAMVSASLYEQISGKDNILLGEQLLQETEAALHREQIIRQRSIILCILIILTFICIALIVFVQLYRKRNAAYKVLAIKAQEWADNTDEPSACKPCTEVTQEDKHIMSLLETEMQNHAYREAGLTAEMLADRLGIHRNTLSHAINSTTGGNFNTYINGFRIKEAVRIISQTSRKDLYIDELYECVGFGSRSTFSRIFKQFTGLAPLEFQKQGEEGPKITEFQRFCNALINN